MSQGNKIAKNKFTTGVPLMEQTLAPESFIADTITPLAGEVLAVSGVKNETKDGSVSVGIKIDGSPEEELWIDCDKYPGRGTRLDIEYIPGTNVHAHIANTTRNILGVRTVAIERTNGASERLRALDKPIWTAKHARRIAFLMNKHLSEN